MTQPQKPDNRPSPLSIRLNAAEWKTLRELAGDEPLSAYVKGIVFDTRRHNPAASQLLLARSLALLGQSQLTSNIAFLADAARSGSVFDNELSVEVLERACADIRHIRRILMQSLGKRPEAAR